MALFLLTVVALWFVYDLAGDRAADRREKKRQAEIIATRRRIVGIAPDSPAAFEKLGDAYRESGHPAEAVAAYEQALEMSANLPPEARGAGHIAGSGLENKLRLARFELTHDPEAHGETMRTRQQICRRCGILNAPAARTCETCGEPLPVDSFWDPMKRSDIRNPILKETGLAALKLGIVFAAVMTASWMPLEVKGVLLLSTVIVLAWKFLRTVGGD